MASLSKRRQTGYYLAEKVFASVVVGTIFWYSTTITQQALLGESCVTTATVS